MKSHPLRAYVIVALAATTPFLVACSGQISSSPLDGGPPADATRPDGAASGPDAESDAPVSLDATRDARSDASGSSDSGIGEMDSEAPDSPSGDADDAADTSALWPCSPPVFTPGSGAVDAGTHVVIAASLPPSGYIFYTTDGTRPNRSSPVYDAGTVGIPITQDTLISAFTSTLGVSCIDSLVGSQYYTVH